MIRTQLPPRPDISKPCTPFLGILRPIVRVTERFHQNKFISEVRAPRPNPLPMPKSMSDLPRGPLGDWLAERPPRHSPKAPRTSPPIGRTSHLAALHSLLVASSCPGPGLPCPCRQAFLLPQGKHGLGRFSKRPTHPASLSSRLTHASRDWRTTPRLHRLAEAAFPHPVPREAPGALRFAQRPPSRLGLRTYHPRAYVSPCRSARHTGTNPQNTQFGIILTSIRLTRVALRCNAYSQPSRLALLSYFVS